MIITGDTRLYAIYKSPGSFQIHDDAIPQNVYEGPTWALDGLAIAAAGDAWLAYAADIVEVKSYGAQKIDSQDMSRWFSGLTKLARADLSGFDTSGTSRMTDMFANTPALSSVTLPTTFSFNGDGTTLCVLMDAPSTDGYTGRWTNGSISYTARDLATKFSTALAGTWVWEQSYSLPTTGGEGQNMLAAWVVSGELTMRRWRKTRTCRHGFRTNSSLAGMAQK